MNVLVVGASRGTGALCVQAALDRGYDVTAFSRSPHKLPISHERLSRVAGSFHDPEAVNRAAAGHDAVIVTASGTSLKAFKENPKFFSEGTANVIAAMKRAGSRRLVILSALGVGDSRVLMPWILDKLMISFLLKTPFEDHGRQEALVMQSGLQWIIARPGRLTNGPARKKYQKKSAMESVPRSISRADVADFLVESCASGDWLGKAVQIGG